MKYSFYLPVILFPLLLALCYLVYIPGLSGGFVFDDYINITKLAEIRSGPSPLSAYLSWSDRPISFLSFLLNDITWPSTAYGFLLTNISLHVLCAVLLLWVFFLTSRTLGICEQQSQWIAVLGSGFWMLHPLFVSTTLYIVQRMTILSAIFVLCSLIVYLKGRELVSLNKALGWWLLIAGTVVFGVAGLLSKQNAALLPLFFILFEYILFYDKKNRNAKFKLWLAAYGFVPVLILIAAVFIWMSTWLPLYEHRNFDLGERLLTQSRILIYYILLLVVPKTSTNGVHFENIEISRGLFDPVSTFFSIVAIVSIIILAVKYKKKYRVLSFSILFYFCAHIMESSFISLELYFEHRNYLPTMMFFFALSYSISILMKRKSKLAFSIIVILISTYGFTTYARSSLWGDQLLLMSVWTENNPGSSRNYQEGTMIANMVKRPDISLQFLKEGKEYLPEDPILRLGYISYSCQFGIFDIEDVKVASELLRETNRLKAQYIYLNLRNMVDIYASGLCPELSYEDIKMMLNGALENPLLKTYNLRRQELLHLYGVFEIAQNNYSEVEKYFIKAFDVSPMPDVGLKQVAILASHEKYELALKHLKFTKERIYTRTASNMSDQYGWNDYLDLESRLKKAIEGNN